MKISNPDGTVIECSVDEYRDVFEKKSRVEFINKYKNELDKSNSNKKYNMKVRTSSCSRWSRSEDKIIRENTIRKSMKLLPHRTKIAIYARRSHLNTTKRHYRTTGLNDRRRFMMRFVSTLSNKLIKNNPDMSKSKSLKLAFVEYKRKQGLI